MNQKDANRMIIQFYTNPTPSDQERFFFEEAMEYMIETTKDPHYIVGLGSYYRGIGRVDLAMKFFNMAISLGDTCVYECLAVVYMDESSGMKDYTKAFDCFRKAYEGGSLTAYLEMAEMYRNGWGVPKNQKKYQHIIEEVYAQIRDSRFMGDPISEVCIHLAEIRRDQGRLEEAVDLFLRARDFLSRRLAEYSLEADFLEMERLVMSVYELVEFDETSLDFYDLFYLLRRPAKVRFWFRQKKYMVEMVQDEEGTAVRFGQKWYRSVSDFIRRGTLAGEPVVKVANRVYGIHFQACA